MYFINKYYRSTFNCIETKTMKHTKVIYLTYNSFVHP